MTKNILWPSAVVANEKDDGGVPLSDSNGGPSSDSVIILKEKPRQNEKGKGPMVQEKTVVIDSPKKKKCDENISIIDSLPNSDYKRKRSRKGQFNKVKSFSSCFSKSI